MSRFQSLEGRLVNQLKKARSYREVQMEKTFFLPYFHKQNERECERINNKSERATGREYGIVMESLKP